MSPPRWRRCRRPVPSMRSCSTWCRRPRTARSPSHAVIEGGVVTDVAAGKASDPTAVISCSYDSALAVLGGDKSADEAFMDASLKVEGDHKTWLLDLREVRAASLAAIADLG